MLNDSSISNDDNLNPDKSIIEQHIEQYYHWGKWLNHAISVYGKKMDNDI